MVTFVSPKSWDPECNPELALGLRFVDLGQSYTAGFSKGTPVFLQAVMLCMNRALGSSV